MHNVPDIAWYTVVSMAKKVQDSILHVMAALVIAWQPTALQNPAAHLLCALLKAPNTLVIKQVYMPMGKLKAAKPWPELAGSLSLAIIPAISYYQYCAMEGHVG